MGQHQICELDNLKCDLPSSESCIMYFRGSLEEYGGGGGGWGGDCD